MRTSIYISSILFFLVACSSEKTNNDSFYNFDYDYELRSYYSDDLENHKSAQFFLDSKLIKRTAREGGCEVFHFDSTGKLRKQLGGVIVNMGEELFLSTIRWTIILVIIARRTLLSI